MSYIGNIPAENYASFLTETFSVSATANYTLSHAVSNENDIRLVINNVIQQPGSGKAYTASGTTLTLTSATSSGDIMYAVYLGRALQTVTPPNASVGTSQLIDGGVTLAKLGADSVNATKIADGSIENEHLNVLAITGQTAQTSIADGDTILIHDASASALRKMTKANFVSGIGGANTPTFLLDQTSATTIPNSTRTKVNIDNAIIDTASGLNTTNKRWVVPSGQAGIYLIFYSGRLNTSADIDEVSFTIRLNNSVKFSVWGRSEAYHTFTQSFLIALSVNDYLEMFAKQSSGSNVNTSTADQGVQTFFGGFKLI